MKFTRIFLAILVCLIGITIWNSAPVDAAGKMSENGKPYDLGTVAVVSNTTSAFPWNNGCHRSQATSGVLYITNTSSGDFVATFQLQGAKTYTGAFSNIGDVQTVKTVDVDTMQYRVVNADNNCYRIKSISNHSAANSLSYTLQIRREGQ